MVWGILLWRWVGSWSVVVDLGDAFELLSGWGGAAFGVGCWGVWWCLVVWVRWVFGRSLGGPVLVVGACR